MFRRRRTFMLIAALVLVPIIYLSNLRSSHTFRQYLYQFKVQSASSGGTLTAEVVAGRVTQDPLKHLRRLCDKTKWTEGLWLHCHTYCGEDKHSACGGLNNVRNRIQTCLRLAIDAGAGVIIPTITWRNASDLADTEGDYTTCADEFWDMEFMDNEMKRECPQLDVRFCGDRKGIKHVIPTRERNYAQASYTKGSFRHSVETAMDIAGFSRKDINKDNSAVVSFGDSFMAWNYNESKELDTVRKDLFRTIKFSQPLLDLSLRIYENPILRDGEFVGVHLRAESDWPDEFGSKEDQMKFYADELVRIKDEHDIQTVYVSCGDQNAINRFRKKLLPLGFKVVDKSSLLENWEYARTLAAVDKLGFDQRGVLEYEILLRSKFFLGVAMSTLSSLVAYARTMDQKIDFFETHVFPGSWSIGMHREYPGVKMMGDETTKLMVHSGVDVMNYFP